MAEKATRTVEVICTWCKQTVRCPQSTAHSFRFCTDKCRMAAGDPTPVMPKHGTRCEKAVKAFAGERLRSTGNRSYTIRLANGKRKYPDFVVEPEMSLKLVEVFGSYWHPVEDERTYIDLYRQAGYECLVIWDHEVNDGSFKNKLLDFLGC